MSPEAKESEQTSKNLVVVGASAGGIEALGVLVSSLPDDFPAPLVLAQHLDPRRPSHLGTILERRSKLPVVTVLERTRLERGKVYVVPSNQHVVIQDGSVQLEADHGNRPRPSVDLLLSTAAESYRERLFAVILTGSGSDGASGAVDVKAAGGTVIIQNPATAAHPSMPQALPPTVVDHVEDLEQIGPLLTDLLKPSPLADHLVTDDAFSQILQFVGHQSAIDFRQYKPATILRRMGRRMAIRHIGSLPEYRDYLEGHPAEAPELVKSLLIKVTEFFRDREAYDRLRREVLPVIIEGARERDHTLRLWSAGCATGEEAYSLAFLASDLLGRELPEWNVKVFATDVDEAAIGFARRGLYPPNTLRSLPSEYKSRFFEQSEGGARVAKSIRQMVIFGQQDLSRGVPFPRIDLILCRNLLIYFKPELQREVLDLFAYSLHSTRGFLFLGKAESVRPSNAVFEMVDKKWRIYRCNSGPMPVPGRGSPPLVAASNDAPPRRGDSPVVEAPEREMQVSQMRRLNEVLLRFFGAGAILIDSSYRILTMNSAARRILAVRDLANDQDFLHTVRELPYGEVRKAIDQVFRERVVISLNEVPLDVRTGDPRWVTLSLAPSHLEGAHLEMVLITVLDATEVAQLKQRTTAMENAHRQLQDEVGSTNRKLGELNKELQDANEELQASNEEMMLTQEELQATNEEFEATNEELQATNEELETNNEELQATNEELETTNEELESRSSELQELTQILTIERLRLAEMVDLAPFHIGLVGGPAMVVERLNTPPGKFGMGLVKGVALEEQAPDLRPLVEGVREVYRNGRPWRSEKLSISTLQHPGETVTRVMEFTVIPNRDPNGSVVGAVLYGADVTDVQGREEQARLERYRVMIEHAHQVALALFDAATAGLLYASPAFASLASPPAAAPQAAPEKRAPVSLAGRLWHELGFMEPKEAKQAFEEAAATRQPKRLRRIRHEHDGNETVWDCTMSPVGERKEGFVRYILVSAVDVTEQARAQAELERSDRLKGEFLSLASHELRTPLTPLSTYSEVLKMLLAERNRDEGWERRMQDTVGKFQGQISQIVRLTDDLLDVARLESGQLSIKRKPVDLREVLSRAREQIVAGWPAIPVRLSLPEGSEPVLIQGDDQRLLQVFTNLMSNAARHAAGTKQIEVELSLEDGAGPKARVEVRDQGPGIAPEVMRNLFTRFAKGPDAAQSARTGLGLGLFIARGIAEQHGGTIQVASKEGAGTVFTVELPVDR